LIKGGGGYGGFVDDSLAPLIEIPWIFFMGIFKKHVYFSLINDLEES